MVPCTQALIEKSHSEPMLIRHLGEEGIGVLFLFWLDMDLIFILEGIEDSKKMEGKAEDSKRERKLESSQ